MPLAIGPQLKLRLGLVVSLLIALFGLSVGGHNGRLPSEERGRQIYLNGTDGTAQEIKAVLVNSELELPATSFTCANCHGARGQGTREGGLQPPPLNWQALITPQVSALTGRQRPAYDETTLARAISQGVSSTGTKLHPGMPVYQMTPAQLTDLITYLKKLGQEADTDPGLSPAAIKLGAALPLSGPLAEIGADIQATLVATFAEINQSGGIYGRKFELVTADSQGSPAGTRAATQRLVEQGVFALVGSFEPQDSAATNEFLQANRIPAIGPITISPQPAQPPNPYLFYLLSGFDHQARVLVDYLVTRSTDKLPRVAVLSNDNPASAAARAGLKAQAAIYSLELAAEQSYRPGQFSATQAVAQLVPQQLDYLFFFGNAAELTALAQELNRRQVKLGLLSSATMLGAAPLNLPAELARQTYLAYPTALPSRESLGEFLTLAQKHRLPIRHTGFQTLAHAAARVFIEATKLSHRELSRAELVRVLEQLRDFKTGVVPPITFEPNRRVGVIGSYIVGVDPTNRQYVPLSGWLVPTETRALLLR